MTKQYRAKDDPYDDTKPQSVRVEMPDTNNTSDGVRLKELEQTIKYENAMLETAMAYPTETPQFYSAMEKSRERIRELYDEYDRIKKEDKS